jgi:hypothetical protein
MFLAAAMLVRRKIGLIYVVINGHGFALDCWLSSEQLIVYISLSSVGARRCAVALSYWS